MNQIPCPDGFLLDSSSPLADAHLALSNHLVRREDAGWKAAGKELNALRDKGLKLRIWFALLDRLEWLRANSPGNPNFNHLHDLLMNVESWKLSITEPELIRLLNETARLAQGVAPYAMIPHLMAYVTENGLTPALSAAIRSFDAVVRNLPYKVNQTTIQLMNSRLDMLAWRDEWNPIDLKRCWSEQIRADYRATEAAARENWRKLLHSIEGDEGVRPAPKWLANANAQIEAIGREVFRDHLVRWFEPFRAGAVVPLSREGSFLLRQFIALGQSTGDTAVMARIAEIPQVQFKPKKNCDKVVRAAAEAMGLPDPTVYPAQRIPSLDALTAKAMSAVFTLGSGASPELVSRVRVEGEMVYVRGELDSYRMHLSTGAIFRESDGKRVHIAGDPTEVAGVPAGVNFGSVGGLMAQVLILARDAKHARALSATAE